MKFSGHVPIKLQPERSRSEMDVYSVIRVNRFLLPRCVYHVTVEIENARDPTDVNPIWPSMSY